MRIILLIVMGAIIPLLVGMEVTREACGSAAVICPGDHGGGAMVLTALVLDGIWLLILGRI